MKPRYYVTRQRRRADGSSATKWGYWAPCLKRAGRPTRMAALGFAIVECGEDGPAARAIARACNELWDEAKASAEGAPLLPLERFHAPGSLAGAFARFRGTQTWREKKPRTREDWERAWKRIEPRFGHLCPAAVSFEQMDHWYHGELVPQAGLREAHRAMKIWRALWRIAAALRHDGKPYCDRDADPSLAVRRKTPAPRSAIWREGEAVRLVKRAWRLGYKGLAAALAVSWDTMLSPVDVRSLTKGQMQAGFFALDRAKTGRAAIGTIGERTARLLASLPYALHPEAPIFRTRTGKPYKAAMLGEDFRAVRAAEFPGDTRKMSDFRRSGAIEATAGEVHPAALAGKMANSIDQSRALQQTYLPHNATVVRLADAARVRGREKLRREKHGT